MASSKGSKMTVATAKLRPAWIAYPKMVNVKNTSFMRSLEAHGLCGMGSDVEWAAAEKVHGANTSLTSDGTFVIAAKRTYFLSENDGFYKGCRTTFEPAKCEREVDLKGKEQIRLFQFM